MCLCSNISVSGWCSSAVRPGWTGDCACTEMSPSSLACRCWDDLHPPRWAPRCRHLKPNQSRLKVRHIVFKIYLHVSYFPCELVLHTCWLCRHHQYLDHGTNVCWQRLCKAQHLDFFFFGHVQEVLIQVAQCWRVLKTQRQWLTIDTE